VVGSFISCMTLSFFSISISFVSFRTCSDKAAIASDFNESFSVRSAIACPL
jgi:hypothetical protein